MFLTGTLEARKERALTTLLATAALLPLVEARQPRMAAAVAIVKLKA